MKHQTLTILTLLFLLNAPFVYSQKKKSVIYNPEYTHTLIEANRQKILGNFEVVRSLYEKCIELNPNSAVAYYELASYYIQQNNLEKAITYAQKAIALSPNNLWYQALMGVLYKQNRQFSKANKIYKKLIQKDPTRIDFWYELAYLYMYTGKLNKAIQTFDKIENLFGLDEILCLEKEKIYTYRKEYQKANNEIKKLIQSNPNEIRYLGMLAESYVSQNKMEEAQQIYTQMLSIDSLNGLVNLSLADFYRIQQNLNKSFYHLRLAYKSPDIDIDTKIKMLITLTNYAEKDIMLSHEIDSLLSILTHVYPNNAKVLTLQADLLLRSNNPNKAYDKLYQITLLDPSRYIIWEQLLMIEYLQSQWDSLYLHSNKAIEYFPEQTNLYYFKALAAQQLSKLQEADEALSYAESLPIQNKDLETEIYALHGEILHALGKNQQSDQAMEKVLQLDKNNKIVLNNYSYYLSLRSDSLDKAERMSLICIELEPNNPTFLDTYAWVLYKQNKLEKALEYIKKAYLLQKNNALIIEHYGDILYKTGNIEQAIEMWNEAYKTGKGSIYLEQKVIQKKLIE
ncbi:MAG: tetratricopeptide repeat protein [Bacteroidales bacterium]|nr:tetratricopeptide repeat protein [Bacteroidales bacterium]